MNVPLITMDPTEAREQLRAYRAQLHRRADAEYEAVAAGLTALADGTPIISLTQALQAGGFDEKGRPRLGLARADRTQVRTWWDRPNLLRFDTSRGGPEGKGLSHAIPLTPPERVRFGSWELGYALVPMIPAHVRQSVRFRARDTFILFEVEQWSDTRLDARPDRDPYLLRHLHGDAYAVLAEWDLTPLEQMVMAGRRGN